jgi:hypothetical protein
MGLLVGAHFYLEEKGKGGSVLRGTHRPFPNTEDPGRILLEMNRWYFLSRSNSSRFLASSVIMPGRGRRLARDVGKAEYGGMGL